MGGVDDEPDVVHLLHDLDAVIAEARVRAVGAAGADEVLPVVGEHYRAGTERPGPVELLEFPGQAFQAGLREPVGDVVARFVGGAEIRGGSGKIHPGNGLDLFVQALERFERTLGHAAHGETGGAVALAEDLQRIGRSCRGQRIGQFHAFDEPLPGIHVRRQALLDHIAR